MKQHLDQGHKKLPIVLPMLFYHGRKGSYPYSLKLIDLFEDKAFAKATFFKAAAQGKHWKLPTRNFQCNGYSRIVPS